MNIHRLRLRNLKGFSSYTVRLDRLNILTGPNNAGKSTVLDALRLLGGALRFAQRRNPSPVRGPTGATVTGYDVLLTSLPIALTNIHHNYSDEAAIVEYDLEGGKTVGIVIREASSCVFYLDTADSAISNAMTFRRRYPLSLAVVPTLGPFEEEEEIFREEYVRQWAFTRRGHRMFRNVWFRQEEQFPAFQALVEATWPSMSVRPVERQGYPAHLVMFCTEDRMDREIYWAGFGFQIWLQILTHLIHARHSTTIVVDEPDIYLHPDLQRRLLHLFRASGKQIVLATHSVEIINEADYDEIVLIDKRRRYARRITDVDGLQQAIASVGSTHNIHLTRLSQGRKVIFVEGGDIKLLKRYAARASIDQLARDVNLLAMPIGGFSQWRRVENAVWTFQEILKTRIDVEALFDRDYRCQDEVDRILEHIRRSVPNSFVLERKEIENYLFGELSFYRALYKRLRDRDRLDGRTEDDIKDVARTILLEITEEFRHIVFSQIAAHRLEFYKKTTGMSDATILRESGTWCEEHWQRLDGRFKIVPGKELLSAINRRLQGQEGITLTPAFLIDPMTRDEIAEDLKIVMRSFTELTV